MACPFFLPTERLDESAWPQPPRLPLGDPYRGICQAPPSPTSGEMPLNELCNGGYARGRCPHFPAAAPADAHRFSVSSDDNSLIRICYVVERDHFPSGHGVLEYSAGGTLRSGPDDPLLLQQAHSFLQSYLRRKNPERQP